MHHPIWLAGLALALGGCVTATDLLVPAPSAPAPRSAVVVPQEESAPKAPPPALVTEPVPPPPRPLSPPPPIVPPPSPPPPAAAPPPPRTAAIPRPTEPPVLAPQASLEEEQRMKTQAERRIEGTEKLVQRIDPSRLAREQQENYLTIQSFLSKAREALSSRDMQRAFTLADKAFLLADELSKVPR
jgi:hypothetical protein